MRKWFWVEHFIGHGIIEKTQKVLIRKTPRVFFSKRIHLISSFQLWARSATTIIIPTYVYSSVWRKERVHMYVKQYSPEAGKSAWRMHEFEGQCSRDHFAASSGGSTESEDSHRLQPKVENDRRSCCAVAQNTGPTASQKREHVVITLNSCVSSWGRHVHGHLSACLYTWYH